MVQWLRTHLAMQETPVRSLVWADPTCLGTTKRIATNTEPVLQSPGTTTVEALALESTTRDVTARRRLHTAMKNSLSSM